MAKRRHRKKTQPQQSTQQSTQRLQQSIQNRDRLPVARRALRRVFVPQDDRRFRDSNIEDFNHAPDVVIHDSDGRVQDIRQHDTYRRATTRLPVNRNNDITQNQLHYRTFAGNRDIIDRLRASICGKRQSRREVLFATRQTGKGGRSRRHLWSSLSKIVCK